MLSGPFRNSSRDPAAEPQIVRPPASRRRALPRRQQASTTLTTLALLEPMLRRVKGSSRHRLRLALVCLAAVIALVGRWGWNERDRGSRICLVGNAETDAKALSVYRQWGGAFPAAFYVWGQRRTDDEVRSRDEIRRLAFLRPRKGEEALPFADGMFASVNEVMSRHRCDYIFSASSPSSSRCDPTRPIAAR